MKKDNSVAPAIAAIALMLLLLLAIWLGKPEFAKATRVSHSWGVGDRVWFYPMCGPWCISFQWDRGPVYLCWWSMYQWRPFAIGWRDGKPFLQHSVKDEFDGKAD